MFVVSVKINKYDLTGLKREIKPCLLGEAWLISLALAQLALAQCFIEQLYKNVVVGMRL